MAAARSSPRGREILCELRSLNHMVRRVLLLAVVARTAAFATVLLSADLDADRHLFESLDVDESDSLDAGELVMLWDELSYEAGDLPMGYEAFHAKMDGQLRDVPPPRRDVTSGDDNYEIASDGNVAGCLAAPQDPQDYWRSRSETYLAKTPGLVVCGNGASKMTAVHVNHVDVTGD